MFLNSMALKHTAEESERLECGIAEGFSYMSVVIPNGLQVSTLESPANRIPVTRGGKVYLPTEKGYIFYFPQTWHGSVSATYGAKTLFDMNDDAPPYDDTAASGRVYVLVYQNCGEMQNHQVGELLECNVILEHTAQHDGANVTTTSWGWCNLTYDTLYIECKNKSDGYTIPFMLVDSGIDKTTDNHTLQCLGYLTAGHLTSSTAYHNSGFLSVRDVKNLRVYIVTATNVLPYLLNDAAETTYFRYGFRVNVGQERRVTGVSRLQIYMNVNNSTTDIYLPAPSNSYGVLMAYNISGILATDTLVQSLFAIHYNNNATYNASGNGADIMAPATLGGGIARYQRGAVHQGSNLIRFKISAGVGACVVLFYFEFQHNYA